MKLQFKHQKFQADAAKAVVDVFAGQPYLTPTYMMDRGSGTYQIGMEEEHDFTGWRNERIVPELSDALILEHLNKIQRANQIAPSPKLEGRYNLTIEMETGVGKTYTYIKTMFELNKHYGWSKFIVVVPSIAIREGVYKSFQVTQDHFAEEYGKKIRFFIYNSAQLTEIDRFASDSSINVMIINSQAFNAKGKDARRIYMKLDEFRSRRPIDIIAKTNPILIIDEPQSVEGKQTKERLKEFNPLLTLRYSATHKTDSIYNMVYRLDAMEAYNKRLVKKIAVKGITESGSTATDGYVYLESINLSKADPTATIQFDFKGATSIRKKTMTVGIGFNLYDNSNGMEEYKDGFVVKFIDGRDNHIEFLNGIKIYAGDVIGRVSEEQLRRIQIRETILSHIERERQLFHKGIKVLSLFFIDEVAKYKQYDAAGQAYNGIYADMFEEEYADIVGNLQLSIGDEAYIAYLNAIEARDTHAGYFSVDKKGKMTDSKLSDKKEKTSDDIDAYNLIMKNKELLLDRNLTTTSGDVTLHMPRLKGVSFETAIIERYRRRESSVEEALIEMYLAGVSVRRVEDITEALWGSKVSPATISELNKKAYVHIEDWRNRPLQGGRYPYVYVDGIYLRRNWGGEYENVAILVAIAVNEDGFREVLGAAEGMKEDKASWVSFFQWLRGRGLDGVKLIVGDKCTGMLEAVGEVFPEAKYQRCTVHFYRNVFSVVPKSKVKIVAKMLKAIHAQESKKASREKAKAVVAELRAMKLKEAAKKVEDGIEETLTYCDFPSEHWTRIRTNNVIERLNREIRRRTRVVGTFPDGNSALMLVCARLRHVAGTQWGCKKYMNMKHLEVVMDDASIAG